MTKLKASQRAKAKAAAKAKKRKDNAEQAGPKDRQQFGGGSIKGPSGNAQGANFGAVRRGAARSR